MADQQHPLLKMLEGGNRRSIGRSEEVVAQVLATPSLLGILFDAMLSPDPLVRMRAADAMEKICARRPEYLGPFKNRLINQVASVKQQEVRWHVAQLFSRLDLNPEERHRVANILFDYLAENSKIVKTFAMQALADIAEQDADLRPTVISRLEELTYTGSPAMQSRGRKLLARLKQLE